MTTPFRMDVERFTAELLKQVQPGTGTVHVSLSTNACEEQEMVAGGAVRAIAAMLQRPVVLHFFDGEQLQVGDGSLVLLSKEVNDEAASRPCRSQES